MNRSTEIPGLPVNQSIAFSDRKGAFKERIRKKQLAMLHDYAPLLKQFLEPGEEILLAMRGCSPVSALEQLTTGWIVFYLKRCALVLTNRRILHFPSKTNYKPRHSVAQIRFGDVEEIKPSVFLGKKFKITYKDGKKETFLYVQDASRFKAALPGLQLQGQPSTPARRRHHLCPRCTAPLAAGVYACEACGLEFKNEKKAGLLSLLVPGGGYFYTNHPLLGVQDFIVEAFLIVMTVFAGFNLIAGSGTAGDTGMLAVFGILLFLEKLYTVYHSKHYVKEYIPVDANFEPRRKVGAV